MRLTTAHINAINAIHWDNCVKVTQEAFAAQLAHTRQDDIGGIVCYYEGKLLKAFYDYDHEHGYVWDEAVA
jgi:hypothetical protein